MVPLHRSFLLSATLGGILITLPLGSLSMADLQSLNRELGRLCHAPPREALTVCRIHARLVGSI
jgi:hypothetical protein